MEQLGGGSAVVNGASAAEKRIVRRSWTPEQKRLIVAEAQGTGANMKAVAESHGVRMALLSSWRRQVARTARPAAKVAQFAAVRVTAADGVIEIDLDSRCVRVCGLIDARMLREVLAAAR